MQFLRAVRQGRWLTHPHWPGLQPGQVQADALGDLTTTKNRLSVFRVESDSEIAMVTVALASNKKFLANIDYLLFDDSHLESLEIEAIRNKGNTPDARVNELHYDLNIRDGSALLSFAQSISDGQVTRIYDYDLGPQLLDALTRGVIDRTYIDEELLQKIKAN